MCLPPWCVGFMVHHCLSLSLWHNRTKSLDYDVFQTFWYLGFLLSCLYSRDCTLSSSTTGIYQPRRNPHCYSQPYAWLREIILAVCERMHRAMGYVVIGFDGGWCERVRQAMSSKKSNFWGCDVSTLVVDVSTLGVGAATPVNYTHRDCAVGVGWGNFRGDGVGGMLFLRRFL